MRRVLTCLVLAAGLGISDADSNVVEFKGVVQSAPASGTIGAWNVGGRAVQVTSRTVVEPRERPPAVGDCVKVRAEESGTSLLASVLSREGSGACKLEGETKDSPKLIGRVESMPPSGLLGDWRIGGQAVRASNDTRFEMSRGVVQVGSCVEVRGAMVNGGLLALRIEVEAAQSCERAAAGNFELTGIIEIMPAGGRLGEWRIGGRGILATLDTEFEGRLAVGGCAGVEGKLRTDGVMVATEIKAKSESGVCILRNGVVDAGSLSSFAVTPGQILSVFGLNLAPANTIPLQITDRFPTILGGTRILFDGVPAPILFASPGQVNVVVPCAVIGKTSTVVEVESAGARSNRVTMPVVAAAPSFFTLTNSGSGQAAALNYDIREGYSVNGASNAVARNSVVVLYATGFGRTTGGCSDGVLINNPFTGLPRPLLPVALTIGGRPAVVQYAGAAPGLVNGVFQLNAVVPGDAPTGPTVPVVVTVGERSSQTGVTIAVR